MSGFAATQWSQIIAARADDPSARTALEALCVAYRPPVLAFLRAHGHAPADAEDLTQAFLEQFVTRRGFAVADPQRGRFRSLLLASLRHFLSNARAHAGAEKRGGPHAALSLDDYAETLADDARDSPEHAFEREWAVTLIQRALDRLRRDAARAGKGALFDRLRGYLLEPPGEDSYAVAARELQLTPNALAVTVRRLRLRLREALRVELLATVGSEAALTDELADLKSRLGEFA